MRRQGRHSAAVRLREIFAMMVAMAMALAPLAMPMGKAEAAPAGDHQAMNADMNRAEHCPDAPKPGHPAQTDKSCCVAGCIAPAILPAPAEAADLAGSAPARPAADRFRPGYLGEIATPPPRIA
ncbi:MAG: hypothetical protein ACJ8E4_02890 [Sphingomicrobium sp.]